MYNNNNNNNNKDNNNSKHDYNNDKYNNIDDFVYIAYPEWLIYASHFCYYVLQVSFPILLAVYSPLKSLWNSFK